MMLKEKFETGAPVYQLSGLTVLAIILCFAYIKIPMHSEEHFYEELSVAAWVPAGALICYLFHHKMQMGSVISAGLTGTLASFLPSLKPSSGYLKKIPVALYCGAFVGMTSALIAPSALFIMLAGVLTSLLLIISGGLFHGMGGKLGTLAFAGVATASLLYYLFIR